MKIGVMSSVKDYDIDDLSDFLTEKGIPGDVALTFTGTYFQCSLFS